MNQTASNAKRKFTKAEVKDLCESIEKNWQEGIERFAHAASGFYSVTERDKKRGSRTIDFWPMTLAIKNKNIGALKLMLPHVDPFFGHERYTHKSFFEEAWQWGGFEVSRLFLESVEELRDDDGHWLREAVTYGGIAQIELILPVSNPKAASKDGKTALMAAASQLSLEKVTRLLPLSDPGAVDEKGRDALMIAMETLLSVPDRGGNPGAFECFCTLVEACGVVRKDADGNGVESRLSRPNPYDSSRPKSIPPRFAELIAQKIAETVGGNGLALFQAVESGKLEVFERVFIPGPVAYADQQGFTPLMKAAEHGRAQMVEALAPYSDLNQQNADGMSALMLAAQQGHLNCVRLLHGRTNRGLRNKEGMTAAAIAAARLADAKRIDDLLIFIRLFDPANAWDQGILPHLVGIGELFEAALPHCDPNGLDQKGLTVLTVAIRKRDLAAFRLLLPLADLSLANGEGWTPVGMIEDGWGTEEMGEAIRERLRAEIASSARLPAKPGKSAWDRAL